MKRMVGIAVSLLLPAAADVSGRFEVAKSSARGSVMFAASSSDWRRKAALVDEEKVAELAGTGPDCAFAARPELIVLART